MGTRKWEGIRTMEQLRMPVPLVEIANDCRVLIEHHQGVSLYSSEQIDVRVRYGLIRICGTGLTIARMTREQMIICGRITSVSLSREGGNHEW